MAENESLDLRLSRRWSRILFHVVKGEPRGPVAQRVLATLKKGWQQTQRQLQKHGTSLQQLIDATVQADNLNGLYQLPILQPGGSGRLSSASLRHRSLRERRGCFESPANDRHALGRSGHSRLSPTFPANDGGAGHGDLKPANCLQPAVQALDEGRDGTARC